MSRDLPRKHPHVPTYHVARIKYCWWLRGSFTSFGLSLLAKSESHTKVEGTLKTFHEFSLSSTNLQCKTSCLETDLINTHQTHLLEIFLLSNLFSVTAVGCVGGFCFHRLWSEHRYIRPRQVAQVQQRNHQCLALGVLPVSSILDINTLGFWSISIRGTRTGSCESNVEA